MNIKNQQKNTQKNNNKTQCQTIVNISLALMKQFNLFSVVRGIVAIIHSQYILYTDRQRSSTYTKKKNYNGQGDLELILNSRQLLNLRIIHSGCKTKFINVVKEIRLNKFTWRLT